MAKSISEKDLELVRKFGKEKVYGESFRMYLSGEDDYFKIIELLIAAMLPWKKDYNSNQFREKVYFFIEDLKVYPEKKGVIWHANNFQNVDDTIKYVLQKRFRKREELFRKKLLKDNLYKTDGKSTERICKI